MGVSKRYAYRWIDGHRTRWQGGWKGVSVIAAVGVLVVFLSGRWGAWAVIPQPCSFPTRGVPVACLSPQRPSDDDLVIYKKPNDDMKIALTFDDGPHPRLTPRILEILAEYDIKATFFMIGENVRYYTAAAEAVIRAGHEVGNHTDSHRRLRSMDEDGLRRELAACEEAVHTVTESRLRLLRPPEGEMSELLKNVVSDMDYRIILWDVDTLDWAHTPPAKICQKILDEIEAGDIILMHDFIGRNSPTPEALRLVIPALLERGYRFVTVGELLDGA